eukprot:TRINITY_DN7965_c0_g1_i5.p1 TRINITY_DN7965_c0_g1~~TRINITY_DN7965_c0_g1_i5.p1  ORF type:complete len:360 (-),score=38.40 TRINITY_DN7965_c0_g1_i5:119-1198(-)
MAQLTPMIMQPVQYQYQYAFSRSPSSAAAQNSRYVTVDNGAPVTDMPARAPSVVALPRARRSFNASAPPQCGDDECVEDECNPHLCGTERLPPRKEEMLWGFDIRPLLPILLFFSTLGGGICLYFVGGSVFSRGMGLNLVGQTLWSIPPVLLYVTTLTSMVYCAFADPGQIVDGDDVEEAKELPRRAHKAWMYSRPVRRYDHYCRWVCNVIGLCNHRTFIILLFGIAGVAVFGGIFDVGCLVYLYSEGRFYSHSTWIIFLHLIYSVTLWWLAGPIFRIHVGLTSRNELAYEWKENYYYIVAESKHGPNWPVGDLSDDEHNELFDKFIYDPRRNPYDHGSKANLIAFWFTPRDEDELGEF